MASSAVRLGSDPASLRSTLREMFPGRMPERSRGTGRVAQENSCVRGQGRKLSEGADAEAAGAASRPMKVSSAAQGGVGASRRIRTRQ